jgi:hypothetical protein
MLPSPGSVRRYVTTMYVTPTALYAAVWSRSLTLVMVSMNRGVANILNNTYQVFSELSMQWFREIQSLTKKF